jgi:acyl carrier protein
MDKFEQGARFTIAEHFGVPTDDVTPDKTMNDLGGDSLDGIELLMTFEQDLAITIRDDDAEKCANVGEFIALVRRVAGK